MKKLITVGALSLMVLGGMAGCKEMEPCNDGSHQRGGKPREADQACKDRKARKSPSNVALR